MDIELIWCIQFGRDVGSPEVGTMSQCSLYNYIFHQFKSLTYNLYFNFKQDLRNLCLKPICKAYRSFGLFIFEKGKAQVIIIFPEISGRKIVIIFLDISGKFDSHHITKHFW